MSPGEALPGSVRLLRRLYGAALLAVPGPTRRQLAEPMLGTFEAVCLRAHRRAGLRGALGRGLGEMLDVVGAGVASRLGRDPVGAPRPPLRDRARPLANLGTDLRAALRALTQRPVFAAVGVLTLAAGIAAGTAVFSVVDSVVLRPLPYAHPETLVRLMRMMGGGFASGWKAEQVAAWNDTGVLAATSAYRIEDETLLGGREPERIQVAYVTPNTLTFLGARPQVGRGFGGEDGEPGSEPVAILEHGLARRRFGAAEAAVGGYLELLGSRYRVIGVMPGSFHFPYQFTRAWVPRSLTALGAAGSLNVHARLPDGMSEPAVQDRADALAGIDADDALVPLKLWPAGHVNTDLRWWVLVLFGAAGLLVLIACANTANLILAQATRRQREMSVRAALGAGRGRLVRQSLLESLMIAGAAAAVGSMLAAVLLPLLLRLAPRDLTGYTANAVDLDGRALAFAFALSLATAVLFGLVPALRATRVDIARALGGGRGTAAASAAGRLRASIVVTEVALTLVLLLGAGLLLGSFAHLLSTDMGLDLDRLATVDLALPEQTYPTLESQLQLVDGLARRFESLEGVERAAYGLGVPPGFGFIGFGLGIETEDGPVAGIPEDLILPWAYVSPGYFATLGVPLLQGRDLREDDGQDVVVLGSTMAATLWPDGHAIGRRFRLRPDEPWLTVVGVAGDVKSQGPTEPFGSMEMYRPFAGAQPPSMITVAVRTAGEPASLLSTLRDLVRASDPTLPIEAIRTGRERLAENLREARFQLTLAAALATLAALLAAFGIFSVISYSVIQRRSEMGVRMALGASPRSVAALVVGSALRLTAIGVVLGAGLGWALGRVMSSLLFEIEPGDPLVLAAVSSATFAIALIACALPALRASRVDPVRTLRAQ